MISMMGTFTCATKRRFFRTRMMTTMSMTIIGATIGAIIVIHTHMSSIDTTSRDKVTSNVPFKKAAIDIDIDTDTDADTKEVHSTLEQLEDHNIQQQQQQYLDFLPPDFRICSFPTPDYGQYKLNKDMSPIEKKLLIDIRYQCAGEAYQEYMRHLLYPYVLNRYNNIHTTSSKNNDPVHTQSQSQSHVTSHAQWGKRPSLFPPSRSSNQRILIIGNSHTRQLATSLLCMYIDDVVDAKKIHAPPPTNKNNHYDIDMDESAWEFTLKNNNTITLLTNHPIIYSHRWQKNLEDIYLKQHPLRDLDAIVLGTFNQQLTGIKDAIAFQHNHPELDIDYDISMNKNSGDGGDHGDDGERRRRRSGIHVQEWFDAYNNGPILYTAHPYWMTEEAKELVLNNAQQQLHDNLQIRWIDETEHLPAMNHIQCNCPGGRSHKVRTCIQDKTSRGYVAGHGCRGYLGGYTDLTAWDVVEALWEVLG